MALLAFTGTRPAACNGGIPALTNRNRNALDIDLLCKPSIFVVVRDVRRHRQLDMVGEVPPPWPQGPFLPCPSAARLFDPIFPPW